MLVKKNYQQLILNSNDAKSNTSYHDDQVGASYEYEYESKKKKEKRDKQYFQVLIWDSNETGCEHNYNKWGCMYIIWNIIYIRAYIIAIVLAPQYQFWS